MTVAGNRKLMTVAGGKSIERIMPAIDAMITEPFLNLFNHREQVALPGYYITAFFTAVENAFGMFYFGNLVIENKRDRFKMPYPVFALEFFFGNAFMGGDRYLDFF